MTFMRLKLAYLVLFFSGILAWAQGTFEQLAESARAAREANQVAQAIELYQSALKLKPDWPEGLFSLGSLLYDADQFAGAEEVLGRFVKNTPDSAPAFGLLGLCEFETGHYKESLIHIEQAPAQEGQMGAVLRFHEAQLLAKTGDYDKALQVYSTFLRNGAAPASVVVPLGIAALRQPLVTSDIAPGQDELYREAGQTAAAILSGDAERSRAGLSDLLARFPKVPGVHFLNGFYYMAQDPNLAMAEFKRELVIKDKDVSASSMLAWLLLNQRDVTAALPYAQKAVSAGPENTMALYVYGRALSESTDVRHGIVYLEKAVKADPQNLEPNLALTSAYSKSGRTDDARRQRERCIQLAREVAPVYVR